MNPFDVHAQGLQAMILEMGDDCPKFTWGDTDYSIIPGSAATSKSLTAGGFSLEFDVMFSVPVAAFLSETIADASALKDSMLETEIKYLGDDYKIKSITIAPGGLQVQIGANAANQGA